MCLSVYLSFYQLDYLCICLSVHLLYTPDCQCTCLSDIFVCPSIHLTVFVPICLIFLFIRLFVCPSIHLSVYSLSICLIYLTIFRPVCLILSLLICLSVSECLCLIFLCIEPSACLPAYFYSCAFLYIDLSIIYSYTRLSSIFNLSLPPPPGIRIITACVLCSSGVFPPSKGQKEAVSRAMTLDLAWLCAIQSFAFISGCMWYSVFQYVYCWLRSLLW